LTHEIEAAAVDGGSGFLRFARHARHAQPPGTPCANCGAILLGPWCHDCGQLGEDFHRSTPRLLAESVEGLLHFDGRIWRTLPDLILRPARLTRAYLDGKRAPQIPPLRLFLVVLLVVFFAGSIGLRSQSPSAVLTSKAKSDLKLHVIPHVNVALGPNDEKNPARTLWFRERLERAIDRPEEFKLILESWSERFAFLMLPLAAGILSLLFVFQRRFYLFDHLIFSMHSLSFQGLLLATLLLVGDMGDWTGYLLLASPVHLFMHMRGVYKTSVLGALLRMFILCILSLIGFAFLMLGLVFVGLSGLAA
jgi:hypothetical protein